MSSSVVEACGCFLFISCSREVWVITVCCCDAARPDSRHVICLVLFFSFFLMLSRDVNRANCYRLGISLHCAVLEVSVEACESWMSLGTNISRVWPIAGSSGLDLIFPCRWYILLPWNVQYWRARLSRGLR